MEGGEGEEVAREDLGGGAVKLRLVMSSRNEGIAR